MYEFQVFYKGTALKAWPTIWAHNLTEARRKLKQQEGFAARAFDVRPMNYWTYTDDRHLLDGAREGK